MRLPEAIQRVRDRRQAELELSALESLSHASLEGWLGSRFLSPASHLPPASTLRTGSEKPRDELKVTASTRLGLSWSSFHYPMLPVRPQVVEESRGTTFLSPRAQGGAGLILQHHWEIPQAYSLHESIRPQEKLLCFASWLFFFLLRTAGPPSRLGGWGGRTAHYKFCAGSNLHSIINEH